MIQALIIATASTIWLAACIALIAWSTPVGFAVFFFSMVFFGCWAVSA